jgi:hypothetical protein
VKTPEEIGANVRLIAEYTAELLLIEAKAIERFPQRSVYLKRQIDQSEAIISDWIRKWCKTQSPDKSLNFL